MFHPVGTADPGLVNMRPYCKPRRHASAIRRPRKALGKMGNLPAKPAGEVLRTCGMTATGSERDVPRGTYLASIVLANARSLQWESGIIHAQKLSTKVTKVTKRIPSVNSWCSFVTFVDYSGRQRQGGSLSRRKRYRGKRHPADHGNSVVCASSRIPLA
jgi:hypothetical protein